MYFAKGYSNEIHDLVRIKDRIEDITNKTFFHLDNIRFFYNYIEKTISMIEEFINKYRNRAFLSSFYSNLKELIYHLRYVCGIISIEKIEKELEIIQKLNRYVL